MQVITFASVLAASIAAMASGETKCSPPEFGVQFWYFNASEPAAPEFWYFNTTERQLQPEFWYFNVREPNVNCTQIEGAHEWGMLSAYRSGGVENVHWKYTEDLDDPACLTNWEYYAEDGVTSLGHVDRTTTINSLRRWCALPVYRSGGVEGKQWGYCECEQ